ncbi:hypothetical protein MJH12_04825, partial [bacterium]|nr:hypothetical protein [bacterium]
MSKSNYALDVKKLEERAWTGEIQSRYDLALSFYRGRHHKQNFEVAFYWFDLLAAQKHIASLYNLGIMYLAGDGIEKDELR